MLLVSLQKAHALHYSETNFQGTSYLLDIPGNFLFIKATKLICICSNSITVCIQFLRLEL